MANTLVRPVISKTLRIRGWVQTKSQVTVVAPQALQAADEDAEAGGIEEIDPFEVDNDLVLSFADQLDQLLPKSRGGVDVHFALHRQHGVRGVAIIHLEA